VSLFARSPPCENRDAHESHAIASTAHPPELAAAAVQEAPSAAPDIHLITIADQGGRRR